ncbi:unnamed protein product [Ectocarpus sp. 13 AM-2016]
MVVAPRYDQCTRCQEQRERVRDPNHEIGHCCQGGKRCLPQQQRRHLQQIPLQPKHQQHEELLQALPPRPAATFTGSYVRLLSQAALATATIMLALHPRLCTAFSSTTIAAARLPQSRSVVPQGVRRFAYRGGVVGRHGAAAAAVARKPSVPWVAALRAATGGGAATDATTPLRSVKETEAEEGTTEAGVDSGSGGRPVEERYLMREERKRRRKLARDARKLNVGRAKSVRRAGTSTEKVGLEALHPPQGPPGSGAPALSGLPDMSKPFMVLGIETSCDDTAAAVVRSDGAVLGEAIAGQADVHEEWGGVVPGLARDSHALKMDGVVERALEQAGLGSAAEVDAVAVTVGPGLEICLRVGAEKAKALAAEYAKPFVAIHHLEAHALLARKSFTATRASSPSAAATPSSEAASALHSIPRSGDVSAAAAVASSAPSTSAFATAFTAAVSDVSASSAAAGDVAAAPSAASDRSPADSTGPGDVSAAAAAASSVPSAAAFAAAFSAAVTDVSSASARAASGVAPPAATSDSEPPASSRKGATGGGASAVEDDGDAEEMPPLEFPFLALLVSGGHCQLLLCEGVGVYTVLGGTVDDALGEAYDKAARLLGLQVGGGGGPAVEALALRGDPSAVPLAVPMQSRKDLDFSFAGLKNSFRMAVTKTVEENDKKTRENKRPEATHVGDRGDGGDVELGAAETEKDTGTEGLGGDGVLSPTASMERRGAALPESVRADLAASFQHTAIRHLEERVKRAMDTCEAMVGKVPRPVVSSHERTTPEGPRYEAASTLGETEFQSPDGGNTGKGVDDRPTQELRREKEGGDGEKRMAMDGVPGAANAKGVRALAVVGGVAANQELRRRLQALCDEREPEAWQMVVPPARLCTDNGVMVAWAAVERLREGMSNDAEEQEVYARLPLGRYAGHDHEAP